MRIPQERQAPGERGLRAAIYAVLFILGAVQGVIGSFQYGQSPVPLIAIVLDVAIFATCVLGGWAMHSLAGGLTPAVGWMLTSFILSMGSAQGTVIITASAAGEWYLYGGALAAVAGVGTAFVRWAYSQGRPR
jgi:hypothetical protein